MSKRAMNISAEDLRLLEQIKRVKTLEETKHHVSCFVCNKTFASKREMFVHKKTHKDILLTCSWCNKYQSTRKDRVRAHEVSCRNNTNQAECSQTSSDDSWDYKRRVLAETKPVESPEELELNAPSGDAVMEELNSDIAVKRTLVEVLAESDEDIRMLDRLGLKMVAVHFATYENGVKKAVKTVSLKD